MKPNYSGIVLSLESWWLFYNQCAWL